MPYNKLASHRAVVCMPYDTSIFLFNEFYSTNMPVLVPRDLWRWLIGPVTSPMMEYRHWTAEALESDVSVGLGPIPGSSPFYASVHRPMAVEQALEWSVYSDWAMLPHLIYFDGVPDLFLKLLDTDILHAASIKMKVFNDEELVLAVENWRKVANRQDLVLGFRHRLSGPIGRLGVMPASTQQKIRRSRQRRSKHASNFPEESREEASAQIARLAIAPFPPRLLTLTRALGLVPCGSYH